jgi:hypothetical protein
MLEVLQRRSQRGQHLAVTSAGKSRVHRALLRLSPFRWFRRGSPEAQQLLSFQGRNSRPKMVSPVYLSRRWLTARLQPEENGEYNNMHGLSCLGTVFATSDGSG